MPSVGQMENYRGKSEKLTLLVWVDEYWESSIDDFKLSMNVDLSSNVEICRYLVVFEN